MANPRSVDSVERQSTRLTCVATRDGQTSRDYQWWVDHIPEYDKPHRGAGQRHIIDSILESRVLNQIGKRRPRFLGPLQDRFPGKSLEDDWQRLATLFPLTFDFGMSFIQSSLKHNADFY